jgi:ATP-binding cassette subfamily B protein
MGFYSPQEGTILVDGVPLTVWETSVVRKQIGFVNQHPILFHGTMRENIMFTLEHASETQVLDVIRKCRLEDCIRELPNGLDTIIGERGIMLSGGQKARVALARALIHDPPILILDEANAMLEDSLEREIWENLLRERENKTTVILSHHYDNIPMYHELITLTNNKGRSSIEAAENRSEESFHTVNGPNAPT